MRKALIFNNGQIAIVEGNISLSGGDLKVVDEVEISLNDDDFKKLIENPKDYALSLDKKKQSLVKKFV